MAPVRNGGPNPVFSQQDNFSQLLPGFTSWLINGIFSSSLEQDLTAMEDRADPLPAQLQPSTAQQQCCTDR